jgi:predicted O-methyltransferase YrrM
MSDQEKWTAVDRYIEERLLPSDPVFAAALAANAAAGMPAIDVSPAMGKFLHLIARAACAQRILEIGTLGAYSTIWLARALPPGGRLVTLEAGPNHAGVARANLERAGLAGRAQVRIGPALETLPGVEKDGCAPFCLIFIDADKTNNAAYFDWAVKLARPGAVIIVDNTVRGGQVTDASSSDVNVQGVRRLMDALHTDSRVSATGLQTAGCKGWDGFVMAVVN